MTEKHPFLWSLFDLNGIASRKRGWVVFGLFAVAIVVRAVLLEVQSDWASLSFLAVGTTFILLIIVQVQRLHEAGHSGYWVWPAQIPFVGVLATIVILCLPPREVDRTGYPMARRVGGVALGVLALLFISRALFFQPFWIPSESMKPTLLVGDFLIATKVRPADLGLGDVIVYRHPVNGSEHINRVIGLPGDTVQMKDGVPYINGVAVRQEAAGTFEEVFAPQGPMRNRPRCENGAVVEGEVCKKSRFVETLANGASYSVLNIDKQGPADNTDVLTVPEGQYFILGDNRDNSFDSRFPAVEGGVGFVPAENIKLRARVILFSSAGRMIADVFSWRSDRYFRGIE